MKFETRERKIPVMRKKRQWRKKNQAAPENEKFRVFSSRPVAKVPTAFRAPIPGLAFTDASRRSSTEKESVSRLFFGLGVIFIGAGVAAATILSNRLVTFPGIASDRKTHLKQFFVKEIEFEVFFKSAS